MSEERMDEESSPQQEHREGRMLCPKCSKIHLRRVKREGFFELKVYPLFGLYPWECSNCRNHVLLRMRYLRRNPQHKSTKSK